MQPGLAGRRAPFLQVLAQCQARLCADLDPLLTTAFQRLDDALYDLADKADNDRQQAVWFDALTLLRQQREQLRGRFVRHLEVAVSEFQGIRERLDQPARAPRFAAEELTLLGHEELEEKLMVGNLVSKADSRHRAALQALTLQFRGLVGHDGLRTEHLPFSPAVICEAFRLAVRAVQTLPLSAALVAYKVFDSQVMDRLGPTYAACEALTLAAGPLPRPAMPVAAPARLDPRAPRGPTPPAPAPASGSAPAPAPLSFAVLSGLLAARRPPRAEEASMPAVARDELLEQLSRLQQAAADASDLLAPQSLRARLFGGLQVATALRPSPIGAAPARRLARQDADLMDLMFLLFEQLLAAPDLPEPLKVLVSRLQIPYVKLALMERHFFDEPAHPARRLLNRIAAAAIGWSEPADRASDPLYRLVQEVVERVVTELHTTAGLFEQLDAELAVRLGGEAQPAAVARTLAAATARAGRSGARRRVLAAVAARTAQAGPLPPAVATIIDEGWVPVLLRIAAEHGERSAACEQALQVLDLLLWSVAPKPDPADRRELLRRIPELLRRLREGLVAARSDAHLVARWLKDLQALHISVLRGAPVGADAVTGAAPAPPAPDPMLLADLDAAPVGTWLALARDDGAWLRVRLAWRSVDGEDLVLVDRYGRKSFELTRQELALMVQNDLARIVGDGREPLVDRALTQVRRSLDLH